MDSPAAELWKLANTRSPSWPYQDGAETGFNELTMANLAQQQQPR
ncbi:hypothetical protein GFS31_25770 [Leptolyngbya sp. BL0902]|nr:hypothetical protein GFS31_25770 [Leptolyngbya sp. BL0902]